SKHTGAFTLGVNEIASKIEALPWSKIRRIGEFLGIPSELLMNDLLGQVIDDLIRMNENGYATTQRPHALYIEDKIVLNYAPAEVKLAIEQYSECLEYFNATQLILQGHTTMEISSLRARITRDFAALGGTFSQRISGLV